MIYLDCEQGSAEWHAARAGIPTASNFAKILTPKGRASAQAATYANTLLAEWLAGGPVASFESDWMRRGKELEAEARELYEFHTNADVTQCGFVYMTDYAGASPDGLIGTDGGLEIKVLAPHNHVKLLLENRMPADYYAQIQGCMWLTEREWWDFCAYSPSLPVFIETIQRDQSYILKLKDAVEGFLEDLLNARKTLLARGYECHVPTTVT